MLQLKIKESGRLDRVLRKAEIPGAEWLSRNAWESLFDQGLVRDATGRRLVAGSQQDSGVEVLLHLPEPLLGVLPANEGLEPLWLSNDLALFNKPAGIDSYPLLPWEKESFANRVAAWLVSSGRMTTNEFSLLAAPPLLEGGLTQRLDRDTSGALLVAFSKNQKKFIREEFTARRMKKTYLALVYGAPRSQELSMYTWAESQKKMAAAKAAKKTDASLVSVQIELLKEGRGISLISVKSTYGTRHVVRVLLSSIGHPLLGDCLYGDPNQDLKTHFLHALSIEAKNALSWPEVPPPQSFLDSCHYFGIEYSR